MSRRNDATRRRPNAFSWCKTPWVYGDRISGRRRPYTSVGIESSPDEVIEEDGPIKYNGRISSVQMLMLLITIMSSITLSSYLMPRFDVTISLMPLLVSMAFGVVIIVVCFVFKKSIIIVTKQQKKTTTMMMTGSRESRLTGNRRKETRDNMTLMGLTVFYILGCFLDMFNAIALISCEPAWLMCKRRTYANHVVEITFHLMRIFYLGTETLFCIVFNNATFRDSSTTRYGLMFLMGANLGLWFDALMHQSFHGSNSDRHQSSDRINQLCPIFANMSANLSSEVWNCLTRNTTLYQKLERHVNPTFHPFTIEFTLLVGDFLANWFVECESEKVSEHVALDLLATTTTARTTTTTTTETRRNTLSRSIYNDHGFNDEDRSEFTSEEEEEEEYGRPEVRIPGRRNELNEVVGLTLSITPEQSESSYLLHNNNNKKGRIRNSLQWHLQEPQSSLIASPVWFIFVIVINVLLCMLALIPKFLPHDTRSPYLQILFYYAFTFWIATLLAVIAGYYFTRRCPIDKDAAFSGSEYLLLFTSIGPMFFGAFTTIAATAMLLFNADRNAFRQSYDISVEFYVVYILINVASIYFQTTFTVYSARVLVPPLPPPSSDVLGRNTVRSSFAFFKSVVLFLAVTNGSLWFVNSFGAIDPTDFLQKNYFNQTGWAVIKDIVTPLALFYRFNSCLIFMRIYRSV